MKEEDQMGHGHTYTYSATAWAGIHSSVLSLTSRVTLLLYEPKDG